MSREHESDEEPRTVRGFRYQPRPTYDLIDEFVEYADVVEATKVKYRAHLREFASWLSHPDAGFDDPVELVNVTPAHIHRFMAYLCGNDRFAARASYRPARALGASARKSFLGTLRAFYRHLVWVDLVYADPTARAKTPRVRVRPGLTLTAEEVRALLDAPGSARDRVQAYLLVYTAARSDEIRSLRWRDVDFQTGTLMLRGKGEHYHAIDIHPVLMTELRRWYIIQTEHIARTPQISMARADPERDFVLLTRRGRQLAAPMIAKQLKWRAVRAGIRVVERDGQPTSLVSHTRCGARSPQLCSMPANQSTPSLTCSGTARSTRPAPITRLPATSADAPRSAPTTHDRA